MKGTEVGVFTTSDVDMNNTFTYTLVKGNQPNDNAMFAISGDTLVTNNVFDFEKKRTYTVNIRTTDNENGTYDKSFMVNILNANDAPTKLEIDNITVEENLASNAMVGNFTTTDQDSADAFTYTLVSGAGSADNASFNINKTVLRTSAKFDFEKQNIFSVRVQSMDKGGDTIISIFTINAINNNDNPTALDISTTNFYENLSLGSVIATLNTTDQDTADKHSYSFENIEPNDNQKFMLVGNEMKTNTMSNFETSQPLYIYIKTNDGSGGTFIQQFTMSVVDTNDAPTALAISNNKIGEFSPVGTMVANIRTTDEDTKLIFTSFAYTLVSGVGSNDNAKFRIANDTLYTNAKLDFEVKSVFNIRIRTTDKGDLFTEETFQINLLDENDLPSDISLSVNLINENKLADSEIGLFSTTDQDTVPKFRMYNYTFVTGKGSDDNEKFLLDNNKLKSKVMFDYETKSTYTIRVQTADGSDSAYQKVFIINIINANEQPTLVIEDFYIDENPEKGAKAGTVTYKDEDKDQTYSYQIINKGNTPFSIDSKTGDISFDGGDLSYENNKQFSLEVAIMDDGGLGDTATYILYIKDVIEEELPAPNYISPNADNVNDTWTIVNVELYKDFKLTIFNGNAEMVYQVESGYDGKWDGTRKGQELPDGVYYYTLKNEDGRLYKGTISVVR